MDEEARPENKEEGANFSQGVTSTVSTRGASGICPLNTHHSFLLLFLWYWGVEPRTLCMVGKFSPTELHDQTSCLIYWKAYLLFVLTHCKVETEKP